MAIIYCDVLCILARSTNRLGVVIQYEYIDE